MELWGIQTHTLADWILLINEEIGEVSKAYNELTHSNGTIEALKKELIHVATTAMVVHTMLEEL